MSIEASTKMGRYTTEGITAQRWFAVASAGEPVSLTRDTTTISIKELRKNDDIRAPEIRLIDEHGAQVGVVSTNDAIRQAREAGLDLVLISPKAVPPVAKIVDYGAYLYQQEKAEKKSRRKQKRVEIKGIRISFKMGDHDRELRRKQARKFLDGGDKVKLELILRGREKAHKDLAQEKMRAFIKQLGDDIRIEQDITRAGNRLTILIGRS